MRIRAAIALGMVLVLGALWTTVAAQSPAPSSASPCASGGAPSACGAAASTATAAPSPGAPLPLEVVDSGLTVLDRDTVNWVVLVRDPNPDTWAASALPIHVDVLDANGRVLKGLDQVVTVLPGQTVALVGVNYREYPVKRARSVAATIASDDAHWVETDLTADALTISKLKTRKQQFGPETTGQVSSSLPDDRTAVQIRAVYRDGSGRIIGGDQGYVDVPAGGQAAFVTQGSGLSASDIASTEAYYLIPLVPLTL